MYEILIDENATAAQMTEAFLFFESKGAEIMAKAQEVHAALVELQQRSWAGQNVGKLLTETKAEYENLTLQLEAAADAHDKLKHRLMVRLRSEMEARVTEIDGEQEKLAGQRKVASEEYLKACAKAAVLREQIEGPHTASDRMGNLKIYLPVPKIEITMLRGEEYSVYEAAVKEARGKEIPESPAPLDIPESLALKASDLQTERDKIVKALDVYDPEQSVVAHLRKAGSKAFASPEAAC